MWDNVLEWIKHGKDIIQNDFGHTHTHTRNTNLYLYYSCIVLNYVWMKH